MVRLGNNDNYDNINRNNCKSSKSKKIMVY